MVNQTEKRVRWLKTEKFLEENPVLERRALYRIADEVGAIKVGKGFVWPEDALERLSQSRRREIK